MKIMKATTMNIPLLAKLINSAYRGEESKKGWTTEAELIEGERTNAATVKEMMGRENAVFLTCTNENNELDGCVFLEKKDDKMYLGMLTVSPAKQAKGIGKKLLFAAEEFAKQQNCAGIEMTVISIRSELIEWYERHGYFKTGEVRPFPSNTNDTLKQPLEFFVLEKII